MHTVCMKFAFLIHYVRHVGRPGCIRTRWEGEGLKCSPVPQIPNRSVFGCIVASGHGGGALFHEGMGKSWNECEGRQGVSYGKVYSKP